MEQVIIFILILLLIALGAIIASYIRLLSAIIERSNEIKEDVFGSHYESMTQIATDTNFLNSLWVRGCYRKIADTNLSELVSKAHRMLIECLGYKF